MVTNLHRTDIETDIVTPWAPDGAKKISEEARAEPVLDNCLSVQCNGPDVGTIAPLTSPAFSAVSRSPDASLQSLSVASLKCINTREVTVHGSLYHNTVQVNQQILRLRCSEHSQPFHKTRE